MSCIRHYQECYRLRSPPPALCQIFHFRTTRVFLYKGFLIESQSNQIRVMSGKSQNSHPHRLKIQHRNLLLGLQCYFHIQYLELSNNWNSRQRESNFHHRKIHMSNQSILFHLHKPVSLNIQSIHHYTEYQKFHNTLGNQSYHYRRFQQEAVVFSLHKNTKQEDLSICISFEV